MAEALGTMHTRGMGLLRGWWWTVVTKLAFTITNSVTLVRERTILTEWPPLVGEISANFCG
jgi:hypothetical protein